jgi:anti-anti-sigma factor
MSIEFQDNGRFLLRLSGNLTGHAARKSLEILQTAIDQGRRNTCLDLRNVTSIDSLGLTILDWIYHWHENAEVNILLPAMGMDYDYFFTSLSLPSADEGAHVS